MNYLLYTIFVLALASVYLNYKIRNKGIFDKVIGYYLCLTLFHIAYTFIALNIFPTDKHVDFAPPFGLIYGPVFYFGFLSSGGREKPFQFKKVILHFIPLLIFLLPYAAVIASASFRISYLNIYYLCLYVLQIVSMVTYASISLFYKDSVETESNFRPAKRLIGLAGILLVTMGIFFFVIVYTGVFQRNLAPSNIPRAIVYTTIFSVVLMVFRYLVLRVINTEDLRIDVILKDNLNEDHEGNRYQKSALSTAMLDDYQERLNGLTERKDIYLNADLSLEILAKELRMPKHHLTQLFNLRIGKNFSQYINGLRIIHACKLLEDPENELTLEEIAFESGFSSRVTFNRYFKIVCGSTPSDYRINTTRQNVV